MAERKGPRESDACSGDPRQAGDREDLLFGRSLSEVFRRAGRMPFLPAPPGVSRTKLGGDDAVVTGAPVVPGFSGVFPSPASTEQAEGSHHKWRCFGDV